LYKSLIAPIEKTLAQGREIQIEPDSGLGIVPWSALRTPENQYLGSRRVITISAGLFSTGADAQEHAKPAIRTTIAIPGSLRLNGQDYPEPPQAEEVAQELRRLYRGAKALRGTNATAANVLQELPQADIFEFAGHAVTREHGGELVVQGKSEAEMISGTTLAGLRLPRTRLAVLSACSTGSGRDPDRDPNGLVRALLNAGADRVIATRWDVDSKATAEGMMLFYRSYKAGATEAEALRTAREKLRSRNEYAHPYFWAGVELFQ
jgi:CHAT domain-containing protein